MKKAIYLLCLMTPSIINSSVEITPNLLQTKRSALKKVNIAEEPIQKAASKESELNPLAIALLKKFNSLRHDDDSDTEERTNTTVPVTAFASSSTQKKIWTPSIRNNDTSAQTPEDEELTGKGKASADATQISVAAPQIPETLRPALLFLQELLNGFNSVSLN